MTNVTIQTNDRQKKKVERVAQAYDCSQSATGQLLFEQAYDELFGSIHPDALERHDVDFEALVSGDLDPDDIDDDLKVDSDGPAKIPTADGGATTRAHPTSYTPTYTPKDLQESGPALSWDELKDAIESHWGPELEIHPDRADKDQDILRANVTIASKIIAAILRAESDIVYAGRIETAVLEYTEHQIRRADEQAGQQYKLEQYRPHIVEQLIEHPDPNEDKYYTSPCAMERTLAKEVGAAIDHLEQNQFVLDPKAHVQQTGTKVKDDPTEWIADLAEYRKALGFLHVVREDGRCLDALRTSDADLFPDAPNVMVGLKNAFIPALLEYEQVNEYARFVAAYTALGVEIGDHLEVEINGGERVLKPDTPHDPLMDLVDGPDEPLSQKQQLKRVAAEI